ncbi:MULTISPECIES: type-F conjugative transfer system pilin assembly protein TraF [Citrobacter]|uniref:Type-F conjugative transfer system pilin assembly protein TraF n=1 Tax=Citrobacter freundii TaxID=546 RepID=A0A8H9QGW8_CITFR|nr:MULTISPECIES: type-F conjugative transfer system pilin assembly protein TraF [Citrobacter]HCL6053362.1 type-F conjugative transfer system pilin assembly protein TraF [Raoultella ornithinolytica]EKW4405522.1 type-F conjugative transfer system pilin assembly protein TraF [Citrobacter freundii]MDT7157005.1 type-F conjugative transfer system pilin assembly protein TraF [Citrobacter freundii]MDT7187479.1 type-F conjugative transfer system pilin assembly protein TraF [Citrobacter freundii]MEA8923
MKRLAVLMMVLSTTLHAAPDEVLTSNFAREEGWQWYNPNAAEEDPAPVPAPTQQARLASMTPSEQKKVLQQATREALDTAILYPSAENFRRFMTLQNFWTDRATDFTQTSKLARLKYPELDYNVKRSHYNGSVEARLSEEKKVQSAVISLVAQRYGLFFFYRGNNAVDNLMAGVIRAFCEDRGITLMAISVDGKISDQLPQSRPDSGQAEQMRVTHFPATFLVDPKTHQWQPLAWGFMSHDDLDNQMVSVLTQFRATY